MEFILIGVGGLDFSDMSLFDIYNVPMLMVPQGGSSDSFISTSCVGDSLSMCSLELKVTSMDGEETAACKSACESFRSVMFCFIGACGSPLEKGIV